MAARKLRKSSPALIERFDRSLPRDDAVQRRRMFGYPAGFVNGNMFAGLFEESVVVRVPGGTDTGTSCRRPSPTMPAG